ncbi:helix-turn-helix transcriptional regulator [Streptomyces tendae]|uniref:helix-turn-helix domain-containing protein n=1 Tax=Streptomyces tendae TaxID=1932 RepID=UPI0033F75BA1
MGEIEAGGASRPRRANELGPTGTRLMENLKALRESVQLTTEQLAEKVTRLGRPMRANTITKIEKGQRRVDVDDLMALSIAMDTTPGRLLMPPTLVGDVELTAGKTVSAIDAWMWATFRRPLDVPEGDDGTALVEHQVRSLPLGMRQFGEPGQPGVQSSSGFVPMPDQ